VTAELRPGDKIILVIPKGSKEAVKNWHNTFASMGVRIQELIQIHSETQQPAILAVFRATDYPVRKG
jgi:hypothetical protein